MDNAVLVWHLMKSETMRYCGSGAQLILVAHPGHGMSVRFFKWEEFFPIEYV